jgi:hypothetical protein
MTERVLIVTFNRLIPADQGNARRVMQLVRLYRAQGYEVDLIYHADEGHDLGLSCALERQFGLVRVLRSRASKRIHPGHVCHLADWYDPALAAVALDLHARRHYRVVHVNYIWYAPLLSHFGPEVRKVLDSHDLFADRSEKYRQAGMNPNWFSTTPAEEDRAFRMADAVLSIQREEAREMVARGHRNVLYLPYVEAQVADFLPRRRDAGTVPVLGYLGSGNDWNVRSMQAFAAALRQHHASGPLPFQVLVGGAIGSHLGEVPGITRVGFVKELRTFYESIDLAINPMVGGTGLKIKTVEPLAFGKPVLTTPAGAQGLQHLWQGERFESPADMVNHLCGPWAADPEHALEQARADAVATHAAYAQEYETQRLRLASWLQPGRAS